MNTVTNPSHFDFVTFCDSPAEIKSDYFILYTDDMCITLKKILQCAVPSATFHSFVKDYDEFEIKSNPRDKIIVIAPDCKKIFSGVNPKNLLRTIVMPIPLGDTWSYWFVLCRFVDLISVNSRGAYINTENLFKLVSLHWPTNYTFENNMLNWNKWVFYLVNKDYVEANAQNIQYILGNFSNQASVDAYMSILYGDYMENFRRYFNTMFNIQYCDYINIVPNNIIINCGIHAGDEIPFFINKLRGTGKIYNIDPFVNEYLSDYVRVYMSENEDVVSNHAVALANHNGNMTITLSDEAETTSPCITLDSFVDEKNLEAVDLIKLDLEGAEFFILNSIISTALKFRSQVAITIYHDTHHMIEIPMRMMGALKNYNFYISCYGYERSEVLLYCIPVERSELTNQGIRVVPL